MSLCLCSFLHTPYSIATPYTILYGRLYSILYTLYSILYTLYSILYTLYSILYTLYSVLCTLYYVVAGICARIVRIELVCRVASLLRRCFAWDADVALCRWKMQHVLDTKLTKLHPPENSRSDRLHLWRHSVTCFQAVAATAWRTKPCEIIRRSCTMGTTSLNNPVSVQRVKAVIVVIIMITIIVVVIISIVVVSIAAWADAATAYSRHSRRRLITPVAWFRHFSPPGAHVLYIYIYIERERDR